MESKIQAKLIKELESKGYYVLKLSVTNKPGIPDLIALPKGCNAVFIEVKQKGKKPRQLQKYRMTELTDHGIKAFVYDGTWSLHSGDRDESCSDSQEF
jgi:hypothetical protein